jgi:hypothetical protein
MLPLCLELITKFYMHVKSLKNMQMDDIHMSHLYERRMRTIQSVSMQRRMGTFQIFIYLFLRMAAVVLALWD